MVDLAAGYFLVEGQADVRSSYSCFTRKLHTHHAALKSLSAG